MVHVKSCKSLDSVGFNKIRTTNWWLCSRPPHKFHLATYKLLDTIIIKNTS